MQFHFNYASITIDEKKRHLDIDSYINFITGTLENLTPAAVTSWSIT